MKNNYLKILKSQIKNNEWTGFVHTYPHKKAYRPIESIDMERVWAGVKELNLYVHVPFCDRKCSYCNLFSTVLSEAEKEKFYSDYVSKLEEEIEFYSKYIDNNSKIMSLYFGGGTPNVLSAEQLGRVIGKFKEVFPCWNEDIEICMECSPDRLNEQYLKDIKSVGIKRISVGVQSFIKAELDAVNRPISPEIIKDIRGFAKEQGININLDLIYGLPFQTKKTIFYNVDRAIGLAPQSLSVYPLAIRKYTGLYDVNKKIVFSNRQKYAIYKDIRKKMEKAGYRCETIVRFVKSDKSTYQQQKYEYQGVPTLGIGAGARSYAPDLSYCITYRVQDRFVKTIIEEYMKTDSGNRKFDGFTFDSDENMRKYAMLSLLDPGISPSKFYEKFGVIFQQYFKQQLEALIKMRLVTFNKTTQMYSLTYKGRKYSDICADIFTSERVKGLYDSYIVQ